MSAWTLDPVQVAPPVLYAAAYAGIADAEWRVADMLTGEAAAYRRSLEAAEHAIALAPDSPDGYWARGGLRMAYNYDWPSAEAA